MLLGKTGLDGHILPLGREHLQACKAVKAEATMVMGLEVLRNEGSSSADKMWGRDIIRTEFGQLTEGVVDEDQIHPKLLDSARKILAAKS